ncbi:MAG: sigma-54-dependent Fis family transcriptional regulator [Bryobacteraceae bacterium]|nr:sigma-54-dependent Fis family transcriptional regulator [Bryobacteraceae bacterium]
MTTVAHMSRERSLIGNSARMAQLSQAIAKLDGQRWPVLILGETGTGKEVVARQIHGRSPSSGPFIVIDCSAIPASLMESELFGSARGAYTGSVGARTGLIEAAHGGTAFFDEVGELPLELQAKLLRVLQEKEFRPVGSTQSKRSDFRIVAATNRELAVEVERNTFRSDLFYRLKVVTLRLPALRDRKEDIPVLAEHFLCRYGEHHTITPEAMETLLTYEWPGNVRELENCIQHMVAVNSGPLLHTNDLPSTLISSVHIANSPLLGLAAAVGLPTSPVINNADYRLTPEDLEPILPLPEMERRAILRAMKFTRNDRTAAAILLGIGRTTLYRKLKEYSFSD